MAQPAQKSALLGLASAGGSGAFWEDRYHCTLVDGGEHAFNCIRYIDLNMFRAGVVGHPREWRWCGHDELVGKRLRYRLPDHGCVLKWLKMEGQQFLTRYAAEIAEAMRERLRRDPVWTESVAVGGRAFVERVSGGVRNRRRLQTRKLSEDLWTVREAEAAYWSPEQGGHS